MSVDTNVVEQHVPVSVNFVITQQLSQISDFLRRGLEGVRNFLEKEQFRMSYR